MEPTIQSTIQQQPVTPNNTLRFMAMLLIGVVGLVGAFFLVRNTFNLQNRAATQPPAPVCSEPNKGSGYCQITNIPDGTDLSNLYLKAIEMCPGDLSDKPPIYREKILSKDDLYSTGFAIRPECTYKCQIEAGESNSKFCSGSPENTISCGSGPTVTPACMCSANKDKLCPNAQQKAKYPIEWEPIYEGKNACFQCEKIIVKDDSGTYREEFACDGGRKARLHQAKGEGCREYTVDVEGKLNGQSATGGADCNCKEKLCCPVCAPPIEVPYNEYFVPPGKKDDMQGKKNPVDGNGETVVKSGCGDYKTSTNKTITCDFTPPQACLKAGSTLKPVLPPVNKLPKVIKVCFDDINDGSPNGNELNGKCQTFNMPQDYDKVEHLYRDSGKYDIAMWCPLNDEHIDDGTWKDYAGEVAVCVKRVTFSCRGGGGGTPPPPPPTATPTPETPGKCPQLQLDGVCI